MKNKEIFKLAYESFKSFKSNKSAVVYLSISLAFLMLAIWIVLSFSVSYIGFISTADSVNIMHIVESEGEKVKVINEGFSDELNEKIGLKASRSCIPMHYTGEVSLEGMDIGGLIFQDKLLLDSEIEQLGGTEKIYAYGEPIKANNEILLTESHVNSFGINPNDVIGKVIDLYDDFDDNELMRVDADTDPNNGFQSMTISGRVYLAKGLKIVGVISEEAENLFLQYRDFGANNPIILSREILDTSYLPTVVKIGEYATGTYSDTDIHKISEKITSEGKVFYFLGSFYSSVLTSYIPIGKSLQFKSYKDAEMAMNLLNTRLMTRYNLSENSAKEYALECMTQAFREVNNISSIMDILLIILAITGAVILSIAVYNFYNNIEYINDERRGFNNMMLAIGMKHKDMNKLNIFELLMVFGMAILIATLASLLIAVLISVLVSQFSYGLSRLGLIRSAFSLGWYPLSVLIASVGMGALMSLIYLGVHGKDIKKNKAKEK